MVLAICIPTYNRRDYLEECIVSIIADINKHHLNNDVQICISDNCSTDSTEEMVNAYVKKGDIHFIYSKNKNNLGADLNYLKCVEIATADYCWLMGSDDTIIPDSLNSILNEIKQSNASVYLSNRRLCDINMQFVRDQNFFNVTQNNSYLTDNPDQLKKYFDDSVSLGAVFSYLSSIILLKSSWDSIVYDESYTGTAYSHVFIILSLLQKPGHQIKILQSPLVLCRMGNDAFLGDGALKRFMLDINGYSKLANDLFSNNQALKASFLRILHRNHGIKSLLHLRMVISKAEWEDTVTKLIPVNFDRLVLKRVSSIPGFGLYVLKKVISFKNKLSS